MQRENEIEIKRKINRTKWKKTKMKGNINPYGNCTHLVVVPTVCEWPRVTYIPFQMKSNKYRFHAFLFSFCAQQFACKRKKKWHKHMVIHCVYVKSSHSSVWNTSSFKDWWFHFPDLFILLIVSFPWSIHL